MWVHTSDTFLPQLLCSLIFISSRCWRHHRNASPSPSPSTALLLYGGVRCCEETIQTKRWDALRAYERLCNTRSLCYPPASIRTMRLAGVSKTLETECGPIRSGILSEKLAKGRRHPSAMRIVMSWTPFDSCSTALPFLPRLRTCAYMAIVRTPSRDLLSSSSHQCRT